MSNKRIVPVTGLSVYEYKTNLSLLSGLRRIESTLIAAGAKPGEGYTLMDLVGIAHAQMKIEALDGIAKAIKQGLCCDYGESIADVMRNALTQEQGGSLADSVNTLSSSVDGIARKLGR